VVRMSNSERRRLKLEDINSPELKNCSFSMSFQLPIVVGKPESLENEFSDMSTSVTLSQLPIDSGSAPVNAKKI